MSDRQQIEKQLWDKYHEARDLDSKHKLMTHYIWLVKFAISQISVPLNSILEEQDFINIGIIGLNDVIERFDPARGVKFESYAIPRIKGMIRDELRKLDWLSRSARKKASDLMNAVDKLRSKHGREVSDEEVRKKLNVSKEKFKMYLDAASKAKAGIALNESSILNSMNEDEESNYLEELPDDTEEDFLTKIESQERIQFIVSYLKHIKDKKRLVISLYYFENMTFKEIGAVIDVSESRVCQIHSEVIKDLKEKLLEFENA